ncbi:MAG: hypothetical protein JWN70_5326 [Planctomycetaceae bacterium]|nr:hypothetical protein [Planctomycetaceae bacterium]
MIPVGYLAMHVIHCPESLDGASVAGVYSVSGCLSKDFADYVNYWKHNGYWFFDSPKIIQDLATANGIDLTGTTLFFYELYELQFDDAVNTWTPISSDPSFPTQIVLPNCKTLEGFDVVTYSCGTTAECSPLSCNALATELESNQHCLMESFERAKQLVEGGKFRNSEPGPFRVISVYSTIWP